MQASCCTPLRHHHHGPGPASVIVGFSAQPDPESPSKYTTGSQQRRHSLLSDLLRDVQAAADAVAMEDIDFADDDDDEDDEEDEDELDDEELSLLEGLSAAWSPSSSIYSAGTSRASTCSSTRPIAIPASTYFKDQTQRMHLDRLNKKRQWYSQQQEQERLVGKTGAKAASQQVLRPPPKHHKQYNGHGGQQK